MGTGCRRECVDRTKTGNKEGSRKIYILVSTDSNVTMVRDRREPTSVPHRFFQIVFAWELISNIPWPVHYIYIILHIYIYIYIYIYILNPAFKYLEVIYIEKYMICTWHFVLRSLVGFCIRHTLKLVENCVMT